MNPIILLTPVSARVYYGFTPTKEREMLNPQDDVEFESEEYCEDCEEVTEGVGLANMGERRQFTHRCYTCDTDTEVEVD